MFVLFCFLPVSLGTSTFGNNFSVIILSWYRIYIFLLLHIIFVPHFYYFHTPTFSCFVFRTTFLTAPQQPIGISSIAMLYAAMRVVAHMLSNIYFLPCNLESLIYFVFALKTIFKLVILVCLLLLFTMFLCYLIFKCFVRVLTAPCVNLPLIRSGACFGDHAL